MESIEAKEVETLRLPLSDDRILDSAIGKTPVMVVQVITQSPNHPITQSPNRPITPRDGKSP